MIDEVSMKDFLSDEQFQHKISYPNPLLAYTFYHTKVENGRPDVLFHWHNELEINYVHTGSARYHIDYDYFDSQEGDIIFIRPNAPHSIHPIEDKHHQTDSFLFHLDMIGYSILDKASLLYLQPLQNSTFKFVPRLSKDQEGYDQIKAVLFDIFELVKTEPPYFELPLKAKLNELLYLLYRHHYIVKKTSDDLYRKNEKIRDLIDYIHHHYRDNLSIDFLANYMGYSKTHFMTVFKQHTGTSCTDFIIQVRLKKASDLLLNSIKPILEIATEVGFNNLSNFNRQFKAYYFLTPSQYRKQFKNKK